MGKAVRRWLCLASLFFIALQAYAATPMIAADGESALFLNADGSVWGVGNIVGYAPAATSPVRLFPSVSAVAVATVGGATHFALASDGSVWATGPNSQGRIGDGTTTSRLQPIRIPGLTGIKAMSRAAFSFVLALKDDGTVWAWGRNISGQLGDGTRTDRLAPVQALGLTEITKVAASDNSAIALKSDGTVWLWGWNCCGGAGNGSESAGTGSGPENYILTPTQVPNFDQVTDVSTGAHHSLALRADGTVWTWGIGGNGENGTGILTHQLTPRQVPGLDHMVAIDARGFNFSMALKADGSVWAWGSNSLGRLGVSGITSSAVPLQVPGLSDVIAVAAGSEANYALRRDGTVIAWGRNNWGQLGNGNLQDQTQLLAVLGPGGTGQLNVLQPAPSRVNALPQGQVSLNVFSGRAPLTVNASVRTASDADGTIAGYAWRTSDGQEASGPTATFVFNAAGTYNVDVLIRDNVGGIGTSRQQVVVSGATGSAKVSPKIGAGPGQGIALTSDGRILTWGGKGGLGMYDSQAQNRLPDNNSLPMANGIVGASDFASGTATPLILMSDGTVLAWGQNIFGAVGNGSQVGSFSQPQILTLPPIQALATGWSHALALTRDGRVYAWGANSFGQLGLGDANIRYEPTEIAGLSGVTAVTGGFQFSAALKADGTVWAWGENTAYQLGDGTTTLRNRPIQITGLAGIARIFAAGLGQQLFATTTDGTVWVTGYLPKAINGDAGPRSGPRRIALFDGATQIQPSGYHYAVLKSDGTVWTGGLQSSLALGFADNNDIAGLKQVPGISDAISIATGPNTTTVLRRDGTVLTWGLNSNGQIGNGTMANAKTPALAINETATGPLDLNPDVANTIPRELIPPFLVGTYTSGGLSSTTLYTNLKAPAASGSFAAANDRGAFAAGYNVYVAAGVPTGGAPLYFQLDSKNAWGAFSWPMAAFMSGVTLNSQTDQVTVQLLQNVNLSGLPGAEIIVGYGADADEMLASARFRTVFTVPSQ